MTKPKYSTLMRTTVQRKEETIKDFEKQSKETSFKFSESGFIFNNSS